MTVKSIDIDVATRLGAPIIPALCKVYLHNEANSMEAFSIMSARAIVIALLCSAIGIAQEYARSGGDRNPMQNVSAQAGRSNSPFALPPGASGPYDVNSLSTNDRVTVSRPVEELQSAKIIARVGDEVILAGDLLGQVNQFLHNRIQQIPEAQRGQLTDEVLEQQRWKLMEQLLPQTIQGKLMYLDFLRTIPKENLPDIEDSLYKAFDEQQLPNLIERANVQTAADLDAMLRSFGSSLSQQRRTFAEQLAASQWKQRNAKDDREISHEDLISYYRENIESYRIEAKTRWEQLTARNDETGSREESHRLVAMMGNEVFRGAAFGAVAKRSSQGPTASDGGQYGWTTKNSLRSSVLDKAIFSLPVGRLSEILNDEDGCHIVRVVERQDESFVPFGEAQEGIREKIEEARSEAALQKYAEQLKNEFPVWTMFDGDQTSVARRP